MIFISYLKFLLVRNSLYFHWWVFRLINKLLYANDGKFSLLNHSATF
uniref:Uncharacterized protein n=1 Tax=Heterorhabditis bacteriophora TaxID=37862 RepID=A0A1I7WFM1_HETBA